MVPGKFHHLKYLNISLPAVSAAYEYDYLSLLAFLDASPALETLILRPESPMELGGKIYEVMTIALGGRWGRSDIEEAETSVEVDSVNVHTQESFPSWFS